MNTVTLLEIISATNEILKIGLVLNNALTQTQRELQIVSDTLKRAHDENRDVTQKEMEDVVARKNAALAELRKALKLN